MICEAGLPKSLWVEVVLVATYLRNRSPISALEVVKTPLRDVVLEKAEHRQSASVWIIVDEESSA